MPVTVPTHSVDFAPDAAPGTSLVQSAFASPRWRDGHSFAMLQAGLGDGRTFLRAWQAWRENADRPRRLHFICVDSALLSREGLIQSLAPLAELSVLATALAAAWPPPLAGFHRVHFDAGNVILTLLLGDARELLPQLVARVDAFILDAGSIARNPAIWSPDGIRELVRLAAPGATLTSNTAAGGVRTALGDAGFRCQVASDAVDLPALSGIFDKPVPVIAIRERRVVVVGAGLAGTLAAERLASREWDVELIDARPQRSVAAVGLLRPIANLRDALNARVSRAAFLYALQHYRSLQHDGYHLAWDRCGVLQLADGEDESRRFEAIARSHGYPPAFLESVDAERAASLAGCAVRGGGWWFPSGALVSPESLAVASLARAGARVRRTAGRAVDRLERDGAHWRALDAAGNVIAEAAAIVLANAADAQRLLPEARLGLASVRGQVTYLPADGNRTLGRIVSGSGYVAPLPDGGHCVGATYQHDDDDSTVRAADHRENLARAETMLPGFTAGLHPLPLAGWTGFRTTVPDRLPVFGATAVEGVHVATGLGSRGLLWAPLGAELLACQLEGEPLPLSRDHAGAISPLRFLS